MDIMPPPAPDAQPPTPSETLRQTAALMRDRAEAATVSPWVPNGTRVDAYMIKAVADCYDEPTASRADAEHIASWHPTVASLIALALNQHADVHDSYDCVHEPCAHVLAARAYLGEA